jgi:hypothetical protein
MMLHHKFAKLSATQVSLCLSNQSKLGNMKNQPNNTHTLTYLKDVVDLEGPWMGDAREGDIESIAKGLGDPERKWGEWQRAENEKEMTYGKLSRYGTDKISHACRTLHIDSSSFINICNCWVVWSKEEARDWVATNDNTNSVHWQLGAAICTTSGFKGLRV